MLTKEQAIRVFNSQCWRYWDLETRAIFQMHEKYLCMPFEVLHEAVEYVLQRPVWTHKFALPKLLKELEEIIPGRKRIEDVLSDLDKDKIFIVAVGQ